MWRPAVLVGRAVSDLLTATLCVIATGVVVGWSTDASFASVVAGVAIFLLFAYGTSWACACIGLFSRDAEAS